MKTMYVFPAVFEREENGYSVYFPDISGCYTSGKTLDEAMSMAEDALCLMLYDMEEDKKEIPTPSSIEQIKDNIGARDFVSLIKCDTMAYRKFYKEKSVRKTLTIPAWLNDMALKNQINFSQILQAALKRELGVE